ncbi:MAG: nuclear transport factor 2 family protein [Henriciella sp.]
MKLMISIAAIALLAACSPGEPQQASSEPDPAASMPTAEAEAPAGAAADEAPADPKAIVQGVYQAFEYGDIEGVTMSFAPDIVWNEAEGSPYSDGNPYVGAEAIVTGVFARLGGEWTYFNATPEEFIADGDKVAAIGRYRARNKATEKEMDIPFVHVWTVVDGAITGFQQYTDTLTHTEVMLADEE